ncbi:COG4705 family protein [Streptomyces mirabilis]|uniref:COG4705 family protein n=1 Tax=Streptomyces mirabilis TaxID=68239 RepID=UPI0033AD105C
MSRVAGSKLPMVGAMFWATKIVATTLGESASNFVTMAPLNLGYAVGAMIFLLAFMVTLAMQLKAGRFRPVVFWSVILTTSIVGTSMSDYINRTAGLGYAGGSILLTSLLAIVLIGWRMTGQTMDVERIATTEGEVLYWTATLVSNTLGTSSGDFLSGGLGLGFRDSSLLLSGAMLVILAAHYLTPISGTVLFWAAYVLTRPLGAVAENAVEKPVAQGGLGVGTTITSSALLAVLAILVGWQMLTDRQQTRTVDTLSPTDSHDRQPVGPSTATLSADHAGKPAEPPHTPEGSGRADL